MGVRLSVSVALATPTPRLHKERPGLSSPPMTRLISVLVVALALAGCADSSGIPAGGAAARAPDSAGLTGTWNGEADWPIEWSFRPDATFTKRDLIAPCPPDAECIWSGIVTNTGTWDLGAESVGLTYDQTETFEGVTTPMQLDLSIIGGNISGLLERDGTTLIVEYRRS